MSSSSPIPLPYMAQFAAHMRLYDGRQLEPCEWLALMEDSATQFMRKHSMAGRARDAVAQYVDWKLDSRRTAAALSN